MTAPAERKKTARKIELGATTVAGVAGSGFGAAKMRDSHREQYPARHSALVRHAVHVARDRGASPQQSARMAHLMSGSKSPFKGALGKPGFKTLAVVSTAAGVAGAARKYQGIQSIREKREMQREGRTRPLAKAACCTQPLGTIPRYAHLKGIGRVHVVGYHGDGVFHVVDRADSTRLVNRDRLSFRRPKREAMSKSAFGIEHVGKAFDAERSRHRRQASYEGVAAGGAVVAGADAARSASTARATRNVANLRAAESRMKTHEAQVAAHRMGQKTGSPNSLPRTDQSFTHLHHTMAQGQDLGRHAQMLAGKAKVARRVAGTKAGVAAGLAGAATGIHVHGRGKGKSYSPYR